MQVQESEAIYQTEEQKEKLILEIERQDLENILRLLRRVDIEVLGNLALDDFEEKLQAQNIDTQQIEDTEMSFTDFKNLKKTTKKFNAEVQEKDFLSKTSILEASEKLQEDILTAFELGFYSEKERSERLIHPVLLEIAKKYKNGFIFHSGKILEAENQKGLKGECDFAFTKNTVKSWIEAPACFFIEAKKKDLDFALAQVLGQMFAANFVNEAENKHTRIIWGAVSTGEIWHFLKLEKQAEESEKEFLVTLDSNAYVISKDFENNSILGVNKVLGILDFIIQGF